jgi:hypothetical protein
MSRAGQDIERRGRAGNEEVSVSGLLLVEGELEALHRFWCRMAFYCFQANHGPNGEPDYRVDLDRLSFCILRLRYLEDLMAKGQARTLTDASAKETAP